MVEAANSEGQNQSQPKNGKTKKTTTKTTLIAEDANGLNHGHSNKSG
jgi:hypothetical protein